MRKIVSIFCNGQQAAAYYAAASDKWKCARCGATVRVVT